MNIAILGYSSDLIGYWDPDSCETGLPGSEESVVFGSSELANKGHKVTIFMNPSPNSKYKLQGSNPRWLSVKDFSNMSYPGIPGVFDLIILWRRFDVDIGRCRGKKVFCWLHDSLPTLYVYPPVPKFDGVFVLSKYHREQFNIWEGFNELPYVISGNGISLDQFIKPMDYTNPYSIGYYSNYSRGLEILLHIWSSIKEEFPQATLDIYYGRETWNTISQENLVKIINKIEEHKDLGVTEHGKVGHQQLANIMCNTSIWAYPCTSFGETFCITAIKCQASGCIPVISRIGALNETIHCDAPSVGLLLTMDEVEEYKQLLLATLRRVEEDTTIERQEYINFAKKFSWSSCIDKWLKLYKEVME